MQMPPQFKGSLAALADATPFSRAIMRRLAGNMELNDLLYRYFGTIETSEVPPAAQLAGVERIQVDFSMEQDRGKRFALWALLHLLDSAPDLDAFKEEADRNAARNFMDLLAATGDD